MPIPSTFKGMPEYLYKVFYFSQASCAASQTAVALPLNANDATSGALLVVDYPAAFAGFIVGVTVNMNTNKTAGVMSFTPTIGGTAITTPAGLVAVTMATSARALRAFVEYGLPGANFAQGNELGVKITTDGSFTPTPDLIVGLHVMYEGVQL